MRHQTQDFVQNLSHELKEAAVENLRIFSKAGLHNDIALRNVVRCRDNPNHAKIIDFGRAEFTSDHELKQATFDNIFRVSAVKHFDDLFSKGDGVPEVRAPPSAWAEQLMGEVRAANSEGLMNAAIQKALKQDVQDVVGLGIHDANAKATTAGLVKEEQLWNQSTRSSKCSEFLN